MKHKLFKLIFANSCLYNALKISFFPIFAAYEFQDNIKI